MSIYLGNLSVPDIERRVGVRFPQELRDLMEKTKQETASNVAPGKWHCFDVPFTLICGDMEIAQAIYAHLSSMSKDFKEPLQICLSDVTEARSELEEA